MMPPAGPWHGRPRDQPRHGPGALELEVVRAMIQRRVDGLIIMPTGPDQSYLRG